MKMNLVWRDRLRTITYEKTGGDEGRLFLANAAKRFMVPYVPARNLMLTRDVRTYVKGGAGYVQYNSPYAHYQYEGILYVSSRTGSSWAKAGEHKVKADPERKLTQSKARHPMATSHWDKAMMVARKDDLTRALQRYIRKGSK